MTPCNFLPTWILPYRGGVNVHSHQFRGCCFSGLLVPAFDRHFDRDVFGIRHLFFSSLQAFPLRCHCILPSHGVEL
nr:MAG TPA: hypothetical protein [Caudoviricetes sp.]